MYVIASQITEIVLHVWLFICYWFVLKMSNFFVLNNKIYNFLVIWSYWLLNKIVYIAELLLNTCQG